MVLFKPNSLSVVVIKLGKRSEGKMRQGKQSISRRWNYVEKRTLHIIITYEYVKANTVETSVSEGITLLKNFDQKTSNSL